MTSVHCIYLTFLITYTNKIVIEQRPGKSGLNTASSYIILINCMAFNAGCSTVFQLYRGGQCTIPCFPRVLLTCTPHNILSKPLAAFPHSHCRNNGLHFILFPQCFQKLFLSGSFKVRSVWYRVIMYVLSYKPTKV